MKRIPTPQRHSLWVGNQSDCLAVQSRTEDGSTAIVHACKYPCFYQAKAKAYGPDHRPMYKTESLNLYLNMSHTILDKDLPFFKATVQFITLHLDYRPVLVHSNEGDTRAPSIALVYLATRTRYLSHSFEEAVKHFKEHYCPDYNPSPQYRAYLKDHWENIT